MTKLVRPAVRASIAAFDKARVGDRSESKTCLGTVVQTSAVFFPRLPAPMWLPFSPEWGNAGALIGHRGRVDRVSVARFVAQFE